MTIRNLTDVYVDQMQDIFSANRQSREATQTLLQHASNDDLKEALKAGIEGIDQGLSTLETLIKAHDAQPTGEFCKGMEGLVKEVQAHVVDADIPDADAKDAMIITQYQRMAHYAIAGYGCCKAFAHRLGLSDQASELDKCLEATYSGDRTMTEIAQSDVNQAAAA